MLITQSHRIIFEPTGPGEARLLYSSSVNEPGILYRITGVLFTHGWSVESADVRTEGESWVDDMFSISRLDDLPMDLPMLEGIERDIESLMLGETHMSEYLTQYPDRIQFLLTAARGQPNTSIAVNPGPDETTVFIDLSMRDRPGILFTVTQILYLLDYDIRRFQVSTEGGLAMDRLEARRTGGAMISEKERRQLLASLQNSL